MQKLFFVYEFMCEFASEFVKEFFKNFAHEFMYEIFAQKIGYVTNGLYCMYLDIDSNSNIRQLHTDLYI